MFEQRQVFIGGRWRDSDGGDMADVVSPHTEDVIGKVRLASAADMDAAVDVARTTFDSGMWALAPPDERIEVVRRLADCYAARMQEIAGVITDEMGSPISFSQLAQTPTAWMILNTMIEFAKNLDWEESRPGAMGGKVLLHREAVGVVGAIVPWNFPQALAMPKLAGALLAGCSIVLKPSPETAMDAALLAEVIAEAGVPEGVVSILPAGGDIGEQLVRHRSVDKIAFTGSTATGRRIGAICGEQIKRVCLELGGKSAAILLDDVDLAQAIGGLKVASLMNNGQVCAAQTRILAPADRYQEVVDGLADMVGSLQIGDPADPATEIGPLVSRKQQDRVQEYIALGATEGATTVVGGPGRPEGCDKGWYVRPTLFADATNDMRVAREEIFGPVLTVIPYADESEAVSLANDSPYGLAGSVWTTDDVRGMDIARRVRVGSFGINQYSPDLNVPFGGFKESGIGREFGPEGLAAFLELKSIIPSGGGVDLGA